jgi:hypothetical protein
VLFPKGGDLWKDEKDLEHESDNPFIHEIVTTGIKIAGKEDPTGFRKPVRSSFGAQLISSYAVFFA